MQHQNPIETLENRQLLAANVGGSLGRLPDGGIDNGGVLAVPIDLPTPPPSATINVTSRGTLDVRGTTDDERIIVERSTFLDGDVIATDSFSFNTPYSLLVPRENLPAPDQLSDNGDGTLSAIKRLDGDGPFLQLRWTVDDTAPWVNVNVININRSDLSDADQALVLGTLGLSDDNLLRVKITTEQPVVWVDQGGSVSDTFEQTRSVYLPTDAINRTYVDAAGGDDVVGVSSNVPGTVTLLGSNGNDQLYGNDARATLSGGSGDDLLQARGKDAILEGGPGNDLLHGGPHNDNLFGGGGRDTLLAHDGDDFLDGGDVYFTPPDNLPTVPTPGGTENPGGDDTPGGTENPGDGTELPPTDPSDPTSPGGRPVKPGHGGIEQFPGGSASGIIDTSVFANAFRTPTGRRGGAIDVLDGGLGDDTAKYDPLDVVDNVELFT